MKARNYGFLGLFLLLAPLARGLAEEGAGAGPAVGDAAPSFEATDHDGKNWKLGEHAGKYVVLYFYPAAMTGGCTKQACSYRDFVNGKAAADIEIVGISGDSPQGLGYFSTANDLNFTLLSDADGAVAGKFGVPVREGKKSLTRMVDDREVTLERTNTTARWTFIVDPAGKIVYRDTKVAPAEDLDRVLAFIRKHRASAQ